MRISDWSSDVCSADLVRRQPGRARTAGGQGMNPLPLARIAQWSGGRLQGADVLIDAIETDTRALDVDDGRNALFVEIGRAHVWTPVTNAPLVCRLLLEKKRKD